MEPARPDRHVAQQAPVSPVVASPVQLLDSTHYIDVGTLKAHGIIGIIRYAQAFSKPDWKSLTTREVTAYRAGGIGIGCVWETTTGRAFAGYAAGQYDAKYMNAFLDACGFPRSVLATWSVDSGVDASVVARVRPYGDGWKAASVRENAVYAGFDIIEDQYSRGNITEGWEPNATSWSHGGQIAPHATILQTLPSRSPIPNTTDGDRLLRGSSRMLWWPGTQPTPPSGEFVMDTDAHNAFNGLNLRLQQIEEQIAGNDLAKGTTPERTLASLKRLETGMALLAQKLGVTLPT